MKKLKILQVCHNTKGPFVPISALYSTALTSTENEVHTIFLQGPFDQGHLDRFQGSKALFFDLKPSALKGLKISTIIKVIKYCRQNSIDVIIAHRYKPIFIAAIAGLFTNVQVWGVAHTLNVFSNPSRQLLLRYLNPKINIIGVSINVTKNILSTCNWIENGNRVFTLPNALNDDLKTTILSKKNARKALNLEENIYIFGTIGRLVAEKSHDILLKAYAKCNVTNSKLVIIGDGKLKKDLEILSRELGLENQVIFFGHVPNAAIYLKAFDAFVFSSNNDEAFGIAVLEAMIAEVPVVSSDANSPKDIIGDSGLMFRQGDIDHLTKKLSKIYGLAREDREAITGHALLRWKENYSEKIFTQRALALFSPTKNQ